MNLEPLFPNRLTIENCFDHSRGGYTEIGQGHRKFEGLRGQSGGHSKSKTYPMGAKRPQARNIKIACTFVSDIGGFGVSPLLMKTGVIPS